MLQHVNEIITHANKLGFKLLTYINGTAARGVSQSGRGGDPGRAARRPECAAGGRRACITDQAGPSLGRHIPPHTTRTQTYDHGSDGATLQRRDGIRGRRQRDGRRRRVGLRARGLGHEGLRDVEKSLRVIDCAVTFRETRLVNKGSRPLQLGGEYLGLVSGPVMKGVWQSQGKVLGNFELRLEE